MHTNKLTTNVWHHLSSFITITTSGGTSCKFIQLVDLQSSVWVYTHKLWARRSTQGVKNDPHRFAILNNHITVTYLRFIKNTKFYVVKQKNLRWMYFSLLFILVYKICLFSSNKTVSKKSISKSVKKIENITCREALKYILALDEESTTNLVLVTIRHFYLNLWYFQFFYYMKLDHSEFFVKFS